jgi:hypothetical protein
MLLSLAERRRGIAKALAGQIADPRDPAHVTHTVEDVLQALIFAIACGYPRDNDLNWLRPDPAFKLACGRCRYRGPVSCIGLFEPFTLGPRSRLPSSWMGRLLIVVKESRATGRLIF